MALVATTGMCTSVALRSVAEEWLSSRLRGLQWLGRRTGLAHLCLLNILFKLQLFGLPADIRRLLRFNHIASSGGGALRDMTPTTWRVSVMESELRPFNCTERGSETTQATPIPPPQSVTTARGRYRLSSAFCNPLFHALIHRTPAQTDLRRRRRGPRRQRLVSIGCCGAELDKAAAIGCC